MNDPLFQHLFQVILFLTFVIPAIFFLLTQQRTLELIRPENRYIPPAQVWLTLIPLFNLFWQFYVITKISNSIQRELNTPLDDSILSDEPYQSAKPAFNSGILYAILFCLSIVPLSPLFKGIISLATTGVWIYYWVELTRYKKQLKQRSVL